MIGAIIVTLLNIYSCNVNPLSYSKLIMTYITVSNQNGCPRLWGWQSIDVASKAAGSQSCRDVGLACTEPWRVTDRLWPRTSLPPPYSPTLPPDLLCLLHLLTRSHSSLMLYKIFFFYKSTAFDLLKHNRKVSSKAKSCLSLFLLLPSLFTLFCSVCGLLPSLFLLPKG